MVLHPTVTLTAKLNNISDNHEANRNALRKIVIDCFSKERAGEGSQELTSKYQYVVEKLASNKTIYLTRPAILSKGFDFVIHVENTIFANNKDNPTHDDIFIDLKNKKNQNNSLYSKLFLALEEVFYCQDPTDVYPKYQHYLKQFKIGYDADLILKVVKWYFIEQDVRYWNWSGRHKFMDALKLI